MTEKKDETVNLIAPNGVTVSVAESKKAERIAAGYRIAEGEKRSRGRSSQSSAD